MSQFLNDYIHLTQVEWIIKYWWLLLIIFGITFMVIWIKERR